MYASSKQLKEVWEEHEIWTLYDSYEVACMMRIAVDILLLEASAIQEKEPSAFRAIQSLKMAADEVRFLAYDIENENFEEGR